MITDSKLKFWIDNNLNVLLIGAAGVGKTARVKEAFDKAGLKWLYFSAATMDPWVDFIGVPKEVKDENGNFYLELVRPRQFAEDTVEAIFMDEFNRASKKIRNAVLELIQFKSLNGKVFKNLRIVWAAINPETKEEGSDDMEYDVEKLDPAQKDRFHVQVDVPYKPDRGYFLKKFGDDLCENAIDWWNDMSEKEKHSVSPRRLDYALDVYIKGGDIRDVLPNDVNVTKLLTELKNGSYVKKMNTIFNSGDVQQAKEFLVNRNNFDNSIDKIIKNDQLLNFFLPNVKEEDLINLMLNEKKVYDFVIKNYANYQSTISNIINANNLPKLSKKLQREVEIKALTVNIQTQTMVNTFNLLKFNNILYQTKPTVKNNSFATMFGNLSGQSFSTYINDQSLSRMIRKGTQYRCGIYQKVLRNITETESLNDYETTLNVISNIIESSHSNTWSQSVYKGLPELFGYLVFKCYTLKTINSGVTTTPQDIIGKIKIGKIDKIKEFIGRYDKYYV